MLRTPGFALFILDWLMFTCIGSSLPGLAQFDQEWLKSGWICSGLTGSAPV